MSDGADLPSLSTRSFALCLAITLAIFVGLHPIWRPLDMPSMDANIGWSYAPIPLLVALFLRVERKLRPASWLFETLRLTLVKFALTFLAANVVWAVSGPPGVAAPPAAGAQPAGAPSAAAGRYEPRAAPTPTALDARGVGDVAGRVAGAEGLPRSGVLVQLSGAWQGLVFAAPSEPVVLDDDGAGFGPAFAVVQAFQPLHLRSTNGALHTAYATDASGRPLFNFPVLPGATRAVMFDRAEGEVLIVCKVHGHDERSARLLVVDHPFATLSDAAGRFSIPGVPEGEVVVQARAPDGAVRHATLRVTAGASADELRLVLP